tara:strand:- start:21 stop:275 length:255 start_codon:yes stop_codon:yes gene_type:complete
MMNNNKEDLKNKIIYRATYRGTKEMDILMTKFVNSLINELDINQLKELDELVNLDDESLMKIKNDKSSELKTSELFTKFKLFKI